MYTVLGVASIILLLQLLDNPFLLLFIQLLSLALRFLGVSKRLAQSDRSHFSKSENENEKRCTLIRWRCSDVERVQGCLSCLTLFSSATSSPQSNHQPDKTPNKHPQTQQWSSPEYLRGASRSPGNLPDPTSPADAQ